MWKNCNFSLPRLRAATSGRFSAKRRASNIMRALLVFGFGLLTACGEKEAADTIRVGTISGPETELMQVAKKVAQQQYGLKIKIIEFSDYNMPNVALNDGSIDANVFQHQPFLEAQQKARNYQFSVIGKTYVYPMGLYSHTIKKLSQLQAGDKVAIPNDPSNEARALLLLQSAGLIKLRPDAGVDATVKDIVRNPKRLRVIELEAPQLPRALDDVTLAAINTNYAIPAKLSVGKDALVHEDANSPYANVIVVRQQDASDARFQSFTKALQSSEVELKAKQLFGDSAIKAW